MSYAASPSEPLQIWVIYERPSDFPTGYVARKFLLDTPTETALYSTTLQGIRSQLPAGLYCIPKHPQDEPTIREIWL